MVRRKILGVNSLIYENFKYHFYRVFLILNKFPIRITGIFNSIFRMQLFIILHDLFFFTELSLKLCLLDYTILDFIIIKSFHILQREYTYTHLVIRLYIIKQLRC